MAQVNNVDFTYNHEVNILASNEVRQERNATSQATDISLAELQNSKWEIHSRRFGHWPLAISKEIKLRLNHAAAWFKGLVILRRRGKTHELLGLMKYTTFIIDLTSGARNSNFRMSKKNVLGEF